MQLLTHNTNIPRVQILYLIIDCIQTVADNFPDAFPSNNNGGALDSCV